MGLFSKGGFFSKVGNTIGNVAGGIANTTENVFDFVTRLPGNIISTGQAAGDLIFNPQGQLQQDVIQRGRDFQAQRSGSSIGQAINDNLGVIAFVGGIVALIAILQNR